MLLLSPSRSYSSVRLFHLGVREVLNEDDNCVVLLIAASASHPAIIALLFLQFKEFELYWGAVFFLKICSHIFMISEVK